MIDNVTTRPRLVAIMIVVCALGGCSLFHREPTPTEQFSSALAHGNSMEAAQIWRNMTPEEKENFALSGGMKPDPEMEAAAKKEAAEQLQKQNAATNATADPSADNDDGRSGKTLADFFHGADGKGSLTDDDGKSGRTLQDYIPYMKERTDQDQAPDAGAFPSDASQPAQPSDEIQVK
jgi:hypothetical protein